MPLIAILRNQQVEHIDMLVQAVANGGFYAMEITMNTPKAGEQIRAAISSAENRLTIGAGTVTCLAELDRAQEAGANFIVTPIVVPEVISECVSRGLAVFPGALTPTEVHQAHQLGSTMVKLFPAHRFGPDYLRDLKAPLSSVRLLATGGITPETIPAYVSAGADGFGIGSPLFQTDRIAANDWVWLQSRAAHFCSTWKASVNHGL